MRGKKDGPSVSTALDPKSGQQWMTFGGGQKERSAGVVDAFTCKLQLNEYKCQHFVLNDCTFDKYNLNLYLSLVSRSLLICGVSVSPL